MKKEEKTVNVEATTPVAEATPVAQSTSVPEYTGFEDVVSHNGIQPIIRNIKVNMSDSEVKAFLGEHDPKVYFKGGKVPTHLKKVFGELLKPEDEEQLVFNKVFSNYTGLLMFYNRRTGIYTILVPKIMSLFEINHEGDYFEDGTYYDSRTIVFSGAGTPKTFEEGHFTKWANLIKNRLEDVRKKRSF